jgi:nucleoside 2-deoxyribosyltransferase
MPYSATVFNVLIASPSDVPNERQAIAESLHEWNALHAESTGKVLLPVMWESHSAPSMGDRPQGIINELVVKSCDMLIGAFWTRLGSPTGVEDSGTVEEIKWFLKQQKPVMLYYSDAPVQPSKIDKNQLDKLEEFKKSIRKQGIQEDYSSVDELKTKLSRHLTIVTRGISVGTVVAASVVKEAKESTKTTASRAVAPVKPNNGSASISFEDYTDKSFVVRGDTKSKKDELKEIGGKWIKTRDGSFAWNFSKKKIQQVADLCEIAPVLANQV